MSMQWVQNAYTRRFNTWHRAWGRLFGDRYKAVPVEGAGYYYEMLLDYVHLNPVRAGLVRLEQGGSLLNYPWSSVAAGYALRPTQRPDWLAAAAGLASFGYPDTAAGRRAFLERLEERGRTEGVRACGVPVLALDRDRRRSDLRQGWYWGSQAFAERLLQVGAKSFGQARHRHARGTPEKRAHGEAEAQRRLTTGLAALGLAAQDFLVLAGSDPKKVALAAQIWENTAVSQTWIAKHLGMSSAANVSQQIRRWRQRQPKA